MRAIELFDTLQNLIKFKPSQQMIADILGLRQTAIAGRVQRNSEFSDKEIELIERHFAIELISPTQADDCITIEHIGIRPACGAGTYVEDEPIIKPIKLSNELITNYLRCSNPQNLKTFTASGDSMEDKIYDGDLLLVDIGRTDIQNSGIFIYSIGADWRCKRLNLKINGDLEIISDNKNYALEVKKPNDDIEIVVRGRVIKNLSRGL